MIDDTVSDAALRLLRWYQDMGVDAAVDPEPIDWFSRDGANFGRTIDAAATPPQQRQVGTGAQLATPAASAPSAPASTAVRSTPATPQPPAPVAARPPARPPAASTAAPQRTFVAATPDAAVAAARRLAEAALSIADLGEKLGAFDGCGLKATAKNLCFYRGAPTADLMVIGEAPGRDEDLRGQPFQGEPGAMLDRMLAAIGQTSEACHITNAVYWRPPGNRPPTQQELDVCRPFMERQVALVAPRVVLLLGLSAARQLLDANDTLNRVRGHWHDARIGGRAVRVIVTYNPNYLIKMPSQKQYAWRDLLAVKAALSAPTPAS